MTEEKKKGKQNKSQIQSATKNSVKQNKKKSGIFNWALVGILIVVVVGYFLVNNGMITKGSLSSKSISSTEKSKVEQIVKDNKDIFFGKDVKLTIANIEKADGLIKVDLKIDGNEVPFYLTDNNKLALNVVDVEKLTKGKNSTIEGVNFKGDEIIINDNLKKALQKIVEDYLVVDNTSVKIDEIKKTDGLLEVIVLIDGNERSIFLTPNGKRFVFEVIGIDEYKKMLEEQQKAQAKASKVSADNKNDKPVVDIFVMSYCPYGTQIEKGLIPVLRLLQGKIDARLRFVSYAMHDKKELDENITQYCIQKDTPEKFYDYLECFLEKGDSKGCVEKMGLDADKLASCSDSTDKEFKVTENYNDKSTWKGRFPSFDVDKGDNEKYNVGGSPTLVINGQTVDTSGRRDAQSLLEAICSGFKNPPKECQEKLSSKQPSAGFGSGTSNSSGGGCGQ